MKSRHPITREELILDIQNGFNPKWIFFWGHTPANDGSLTKSCFSQWWAGHSFEVHGIRYATAEHFMMAEKARLLGDEATCAEILASKTPAIAKKLGRKIVDFDEATWIEHRWEIVVRGNEAKFSQNACLRAYLLQTGDRVIVEASPVDPIWGIGMAADHASAENPSEWRGQNLLGFALMQVRDQLQNIATK